MSVVARGSAGITVVTITFEVAGLPVTQGSMRAFVRNGRPILTSTSGQKLKDWRQDIAYAAQVARDGEYADSGVPVSVSLAFTLPRPKSAPKSVRYPTKKPDLDKLIRAALDALTMVVFKDDSQVVELSARKRFAEGAPGVTVVVQW